MRARFFGTTNPELIDDLTIKIFHFFDARTLTHTARLVNRDWYQLTLCEAMRHARETAFNHMQIYSQALKKCNYFPGATPDNFTAVILKGGLTNSTFKIVIQDHACVVRLSGQNTGQFISRMHEETNAKIASAERVNPPIYFFDAASGVQITQYLESPLCLSVDNFKDKDNIRAALSLLHKIHQFKNSFINDVDIFERNREFFSLIEKNGVKLPAVYEVIAKKINTIEEMCSLLNLKKVPCHNDATPPNFVLSGGEIKMIDWEYSGNNFQEYEYAYWCVEAHYTLEQADEIYHSYLASLPDFNHSLFIVCMLVAESWVALWGFLQIALDNCSDDLVDPEAYAIKRLKNGFSMLENDVFIKAFNQLKEMAESQIKLPSDPCRFFHHSTLSHPSSEPDRQNTTRFEL